MSNKSGVDRLCTAERLVRANYYSNTYRAKLKLGGVLKDWDIMHISIPFSHEKEKRLLAAHPMTSTALKDFYADFDRRVANEIALMKRIHSDETLSANFVKYLYVERNKETNGHIDYYLITDTMESIVQSEFIADNRSNLINLLQISARCTQTLKLLQEHGIHVGAYDLDTIYLASAEGKKLMKIGGLLYASELGQPTTVMPATFPMNGHTKVRDGQSATTETDMYSIFAMLWSMLSGKHYADKPDFTIYPQYATEEMRQLLEKGLSDTAVLKEVHNATHALIKQIKRGEVENVSFSFSEPMYVTLLQKAEAMEELEAGPACVDDAPVTSEADEAAEEAGVPSTETNDGSEGENSTGHETDAQDALEGESAEANEEDTADNSEPSQANETEEDEKASEDELVFEDAVLHMPSSEDSGILAESQTPVRDAGDAEEIENNEEKLSDTLAVERSELKNDTNTDDQPITNKGRAKILIPLLAAVACVLVAVFILWAPKSHTQPQNGHSYTAVTDNIPKLDLPVMQDPPPEVIPEPEAEQGTESDPEPEQPTVQNLQTETPKPQKPTTPAPQPQPETPTVPEPDPIQPEPEKPPEVVTPSPEPEPDNDEDSFSVTPDSVRMAVGDTVQLRPSDTCTWSSSNPDVAYVSRNGLIGVGAGQCTITARQSSTGASVSISVTVE